MNKLNFVAVATGVIVSAFCVNDFISRLPHKATEATQSQQEPEVQLFMPLLKKTTSAAALALFEEDSEAEALPATETPEPPKVVPRADEVLADGKLIRLVAVFNSKESQFAIIEQRDAKTGQKLAQKQLNSQGQVGSFKVHDISVNQITLQGNENKIVFEMYKKPRFVKG